MQEKIGQLQQRRIAREGFAIVDVKARCYKLSILTLRLIDVATSNRYLNCYQYSYI
jgi:hypothetical protein